MDLRKEFDSKTLAGQLRKPEGELGIKVSVNMNKGNRLMNLETIRQLQVANNDNILEIGMANGFFVKDIVGQAQNVSYTGCDFSETMIKEAFALNNIFSGNVKFVLADAEQLPFEDEVFDKVFTINTIYFWSDATQILGEIKRVLKPGGIFIITLRPKNVMQQLPVVEHGFTTFTKDEAISLLSTNDFQTVSAIESEDIDIRVEENVVKNAFVIIKTRKG